MSSTDSALSAAASGRPGRSRRRSRLAVLAALSAAGVVVLALAPAAALASGGAATADTRSAASMICHSARQPALAVKMSRQIIAAIAGRTSLVGLAVQDSKTGINCRYHSDWQFYSASAVKVTILAALLHKTQVQRRSLTATERALATLMITQSDNNAATALWNDTGRTWMQTFLNLAGMTNTRLDPGGAWGLTLITARDELKQLTVLTQPNKILSDARRAYELSLMARVVSWQRWGVPAGAPASVTVHVKNGWLPLPTGGWHINSIGAFTSVGRTYLITVLTSRNPTMN